MHNIANEDIQAILKKLVKKSPSKYNKALQREHQKIVQKRIYAAARQAELSDYKQMQSYRTKPIIEGDTLVSADHHAMWAEFGTGIVAKKGNKIKSPYPLDINEHGESGWTYLGGNGTTIHTRGDIGQGIWTKSATITKEDIKRLIRLARDRGG